MGTATDWCRGAASYCSDYVSDPPFLSSAIDPNVLLMIDNSASMYDLAYVGNQKYCFDDTFNNTVTYEGYFDPGGWYQYAVAEGRFKLVGGRPGRRDRFFRTGELPQLGGGLQVRHRKKDP
ncbi:MAG: hypothetical protein JRJ60_18235, partial [Deltaproteobacteria bacterium]|nr:hypothetical protein [Deltaproteobacteria bacterium]